MDKKYKAQFSSTIKLGKAITKEELAGFKQNFAAASDSMDHLKAFLPTVNEGNPDLLPVAFDSAVINLINANDDGILSKSALSLAKTAPFKFINVEHDRMYVVGTLVNYGFATLDGQKLEEENLVANDEPYYLCLGGYIWKSVDPHLASLIEEASNPNSGAYKALAVSWEVGFDSYDISLGSKKLKDAVLVTDQAKKDEYDKYLKCNGGCGFLPDGTPLHRIVNDANPTLYGIGITSNPAAPVTGILTASKNNLKKNEENKEIISQSNKLNVTKISMINEISDITDDSIKEMKASAIRDFIKTEIRNKDTELSTQAASAQTEKDRLSTEVESYKTKASELETTSNQLKDQIATMEGELNKIKASQEAAEKSEKFNLRVQALKEDYNLDDSAVTVIASQISELDDTSFDLWKNNFAILAVGLKKNAKKDEGEDAKAALLAKANAEAAKLPNGQSTPEDMRKRFANAFKPEITKNTVTL